MATDDAAKDDDDRHRKRAERVKALLAKILIEHADTHYYGKVTIEMEFKDGRMESAHLNQRTSLR